MSHVVIEFVSGTQPCIADGDLVLTTIADKEGLSLADLLEQAGPAIGSIIVWNARTEKAVAIYHEMRSLLGDI